MHPQAIRMHYAMQHAPVDKSENECMATHGLPAGNISMLANTSDN